MHKKRLSGLIAENAQFLYKKLDVVMKTAGISQAKMATFGLCEFSKVEDSIAFAQAKLQEILVQLCYSELLLFARKLEPIGKAEALQTSPTGGWISYQR